MKSNLARLMKEKNIKIRQLEEISGVNNVTICRARTDEKIGRCSLDTLARIAHSLNVPISDLFSDE